MATISLRVPDRELSIFKDYAKINNTSLSEIIRRAMIERIETEYDMSVFEEYEKDKATGNTKTYSHDEAWKELGL
ncbi:MAG: CopG family transcriptional regulator [Anaerovibrio sp.]|nr:CopG family transcriptional regulator [Anaerovibrio sp.]